MAHSVDFALALKSAAIGDIADIRPYILYILSVANLA